MKEIDFDKMEEIVRHGGDIMLTAKLSDDEVHKKEGGANFSTDYDLEIQKFLIRNLKEILPEATFYGEEETEGSDQSVRSDYVFYIDPIDGTTNFMFGYNHSCTSVGLAYKGQIIAGFVYNPYVNEMYRAIRGQGATLNNRILKIQDKAISEGIAGFDATRYNEGEGKIVDILFDVVKVIFRKALATREGGSSTLDLCRVASGANVVYIQYVLKPYDYAAAMLIVEEAGGIITQMDGSSLSLDSNSSAICGTKTAWKEAKELIEQYSNKLLL